jgi:hypothetical protein
LELLPEDQKYLANLFGVMGPGKVLKSWFQEAFKESNELNLLEKGDSISQEEKFVSRLDQIEEGLLELSQVKYGEYIRKLDKKSQTEIIGTLIKEKIELPELQLMEMFGGRDKLQRELEIITNMDFHKQFMMELKSESWIMIPRKLIFQLIHLNPTISF